MHHPVQHALHHAIATVKEGSSTTFILDLHNCNNMKFIISQVITILLLVVLAALAADDDSNKPKKRLRIDRDISTILDLTRSPSHQPIVNTICQGIQSKWRRYFPQAHSIGMQFCVENVPSLQDYITSQYQSWDKCFRSPDFQQHPSRYTTPQQVFDKLQRERTLYFDSTYFLGRHLIPGPPSSLSDEQYALYFCQLYFNGNVNEFVRDYHVGILYERVGRSWKALGQEYRRHSQAECSQIFEFIAKGFPGKPLPTMDECIPVLPKVTPLLRYFNFDWTALLGSVDRSDIMSIEDEQVSVFERLVLRINQQLKCARLVDRIFRHNQSVPYPQGSVRSVILQALKKRYDDKVIRMCTQSHLLEALQTSEKALADELVFDDNVDFLMETELEG